MNCVSCAQSMELADKQMRCACGGVWLAETIFLDYEAGRQWAWVPRDGAARACPMCAKDMQPIAIDGVPLDRCDGHGIWFDRGEVEAVLPSLRTGPSTGFKVATGFLDLLLAVVR